MPIASTGLQLGVALLRVSTDRQFQEGESIENQKRKVDLVAGREHVDLVRYFTEHYSGRKDDRVVLEEMFAFLADNRDIRVVIVGDIDRFTRGGSDIYLTLKRRLRELDVRLIDTSGIIQPERNRLEHLGVEYAWSIESPSRYAEVFMAEKARAEASDILTRVIGQEIQLTREGFQVRQANFGYRNQKIATETGQKKTIMVPQPEEAKYIIAMYEMRADGKLTDQQICNKLNAMGYRSRRMNRYDPKTRAVIGRTEPQKLTIKQLQKYISRVIYCGVRSDKWNGDKPIKAPFDPLVSVDVFNRANRGKVTVTLPKNAKAGDIAKIETNRVSYQSHKNGSEFLLRHVVLCPECSKPFVASKSKGKLGNYFGYYHCSRKHPYFSVAAHEFENTIGNYLDRLQAKPGFLDLFREVVREVWIRKRNTHQEIARDIHQHVTALKDKQEGLIQRLIAVQSDVVIKRIEKEIETLEIAIQEAELHEMTALTEPEIAAYFDRAKRAMEHPKDYVFCADTKPDIENRWSFIFRAKPNWHDFTDGTPELTLLYRFNADTTHEKGRLVHKLSKIWNTFESELRCALRGY